MPSNARKNTPVSAPQQVGDAMRQGSAKLVSPPAGGLAASMRQGTSKNGGDAGYNQLGNRMKQGSK